MHMIPFAYDGGAVRVIDRAGEPWFVAKDVATVLGYARPENAVSAHCKAAERVDLGYSPKQGGTPLVTIIPERDVYRLFMRSKLPAAERFEEWVVGEVLPAIRRTGSYGPALARIEQRIDAIDRRMDAIEQRVVRLEGAMAQLAEAMLVLTGRVTALEGPQKVAAARATAGELMQRVGVANPPKGAARWLSNRLARLHEINADRRGVAVTRCNLGTTEARTFDLQFSLELLSGGLGQDLRRYCEEKRGQLKLRLVPTSGGTPG